MNRFNLQLISLLVLDLLSVNLPFLWIFHSEWRYHARKTAGILLGYLIMACGLFLFAARLHTDRFPLKQGEQFAWSGNTGSPAGPPPPFPATASCGLFP